MGLIRLIVFGLLLWILWVMYKRYVAGKSKQSKPRVSSRKAVKCSFCNVHLPMEEALEHEARWFCSRQHKEAYLNNPDKK